MAQKKRVNERTVVFLEDYANKAKGTVMKCDVTIANSLLNKGVAELTDAPPVVIVKKEEVKKPKKNKKK